MQKTKLNNQGFGIVGILITVLVVAAVGGAGYLVWHKNHESKKSTQNSKTDSASSNKSTGTEAAVDPYQGWKTYTDSANHYSFKYPAGWIVNADDSSSPVSVSVRNPENNALISYTNPFVKDGDLSDFYVSSLDDVASLTNLKVFGGVSADTNTPEYFVVDSSQVSGLVVGNVGQITNTARFETSNASNAQMAAYPIGSVFTSEQAKAWFASTDAKTTLLILKSLAR